MGSFVKLQSHIRSAILDDVIGGGGLISLKDQLYSAECHPSPKTMTGLFITFNRDMVIGTQRNAPKKRSSGPYSPFLLLCYSPPSWMTSEWEAPPDIVFAQYFRAIFSQVFSVVSR